MLTVCLGKSTYARCGIIVNVTPFEPEWEGTATLEISNTTPLPAKIYANEGIAQVLFFQSDEPCEVSYADKKGKYLKQLDVTLPADLTRPIVDAFSRIRQAHDHHRGGSATSAARAMATSTSDRCCSRWLGIDFNGPRAACPCFVQQPRRGIDQARRSNREEHLAVRGDHRRLRRAGWNRFAEPDDGRSRKRTARLADRSERERHRQVFPFLPAAGSRALEPPDRPVVTDDGAGAGALVQPVHVLRDQRESRPLTPTRENVMSRIAARIPRSAADASRTIPIPVEDYWQRPQAWRAVPAGTFARGRPCRETSGRRWRPRRRPRSAP